MSTAFTNTFDFSRTKEILDEAAALTPEEFEQALDNYLERLNQIGTKLGKTILRKRVQELRKEANAQKKAQAKALAASRGAGSYIIKDGGFVLETPTAAGVIEYRITNFVAEITADITADDDSGKTTHLYEIAASVNGTTRTTSIKATEFGDLEWIPDLLGSAAITYVVRAANDHVRVAIQSLSANKVEKTVYTHTGWRLINGQWLYLHGAGAIGPNGPVPEIQVTLEATKLSAFQLPPPPADPKPAIAATLEFLELAPKRLTVPIYGAHLRALLGNVDFSVYLFGETGIFKTQVALLAQQNYGAGFFSSDKLPGSFRSTANYNEGISFTLKDAICVIDDFHPSPSGHERDKMIREATSLIRAQGNQTGRGRMNRDHTLEAPMWPRGLLLITGEDDFPGQSLNSRLFIVEFRHGDIPKDKLTACQRNATAGAYAQTTAAYVQWLAQSLPEVRQWFSREVARWQQALDYHHPRISSMHAQQLAAFAIFAEFLQDLGFHTATETDEFMQNVANALHEAAAAQKEFQSAGANPSERFPQLLMSAVGAGEAHLASIDGNTPGGFEAACGWRERTVGTGDNERSEWVPQGLRIGWLETSGQGKAEAIYLDPAAAYKAAQKISANGQGLEVSLSTLTRRLCDNGCLKNSGRHHNRILTRKTLQGSRKYVLHLRPNFLNLG
jgi:hypothetical protein